MDTNYYNQTDLAKHWNISERTLEHWRMKGIGPLFLKLGKRVVYRVEDVRDYEAQSLRKSTSQPTEESAA